MRVHGRSAGDSDTLGDAAVVGVRMGEEDCVDILETAADRLQLAEQRSPVAGQASIQQREPPSLLNQVQVDVPTSEAPDASSHFHAASPLFIS